MAKQKKDRSGKRYVKRDPLDVKLKYEPWRLVGVFHSPLALINQLENDGSIMVEDDIPVFRDIDDGKLYAMQPAMSGFIELFELFEEQYKHPLPLEPLRILLGKIMDDQAIIHADDTAAARTSIETIRQAMLNLTRGQADQLVNDYRLKEALNGNIFD